MIDSCFLNRSDFQVMCADSSFDELLNLVEMNDQLACDPEAAGCGKLNYTHRILSSPPRVFITGKLLSFQKNNSISLRNKKKI